jgi:hypothetical protein
LQEIRQLRQLQRGVIFTSLKQEVRATPLTGLSTATGGVISASDTVLASLGKLQNQISSSGSSSPTWVDIATVGTVQSYVTPINVQVSKFQGMLWIRGTFNVNTTIAVNNELFRITAQAYKPYSYSTAGSARLLQVVNAWNLSATAAKQLGFSALGNITDHPNYKVLVVDGTGLVLCTSSTRFNVGDRVYISGNEIKPAHGRCISNRSLTLKQMEDRVFSGFLLSGESKNGRASK